MAEDRAKVKLGTSGGSIYTPGTPTMRAAGGMNSGVTTSLRNVVAADPQMNYAADAAGQVRGAYAQGGLPRAVGQVIGSTAAAPLAVAMDIGEKYVAPIQQSLVGMGAAGYGALGEAGRGMVGGDAPLAAVAPSQGIRTASVVAPLDTVPAHRSTPQLATASSHGIRPAPVTDGAAPQVGAGQEGTGVITDASGRKVWFDGKNIGMNRPRTGAPWQSNDTGSIREGAAPQRGLTTTFADGTTEFTPASQGTSYSRATDPNYVELSAAERGGGAAFVPRKDPGVYTPRAANTWGDVFQERRERRAFEQNIASRNAGTAEATAAANIMKTLTETGQIPAEGESVRGLRTLQGRHAEAQTADIPESRKQLEGYYATLAKNADAKAVGESPGLKAYSVETPVGKHGLNTIKRPMFYDPATGKSIDPEKLGGGGADIKQVYQSLPPEQQTIIQQYAKENPAATEVDLRNKINSLSGK